MHLGGRQEELTRPGIALLAAGGLTALR